jgi:hypothetical protein
MKGTFPVPFQVHFFYIFKPFYFYECFSLLSGTILPVFSDPFGQDIKLRPRFMQVQFDKVVAVFRRPGA